MEFKLTEEQQMLQDTVDRLVRDSYSFEARESFYRTEPGYSPEFWQQLGALGLTAVPFAEDFGGFGGSGVELMLVMTALGRGLCLEPYLQSVVYGGGLLDQLGSPQQKESLLPQVASGELQLAVALDEPQSHYYLNDVRTQARKEGDDWLLSGHKSVVVGGHSAGLVLVSARTSGNPLDEQGISLFLVDPETEGVRRRSYAMNNGQKGCDLYLDNVRVVAGNILGDTGNVLAALHYQQGRAIAAQCAQALGSMQEVCAFTLDYLKTRNQFGMPIGKFQALQHRMVDMRTELELATSMTLLAACVADQDDSEERSRTLAAAKFILVRGGRFIAEQGIQLHGGIGMTWEYVMAHHAKQLIMISHQMGDDDHHLKAYSALLSI